jgi:predicted nucleic acid-binding protein
MALILDTSFLIALDKINQLQLLNLLSESETLLISSGVRDELSVSILKNLDPLNVQIQKVPAPTVDDELLVLSKQEKAMLYSNDGELRHRAQLHGCVAFGPEDFLFQLLYQKAIRPDEYRRLIGELQKKSLISRKRMAQYLQLEP